MMSISQILTYLSIWSITGCVLFSIYVIIAFHSGLVYTARKQDGTLKQRIPISGILASGSLLAGIIVFQIAANRFGLTKTQTDNLRFTGLYLLNFVHYVFLFIFDTLIIDGLVLSIWRPAFLNLPDSLSKESMSRHILFSIPVGLIAGALLSAASSAISYFFVMV